MVLVLVRRMVQSLAPLGGLHYADAHLLATISYVDVELASVGTTMSSTEPATYVTHRSSIDTTASAHLCPYTVPILPQISPRPVLFDRGKRTSTSHGWKDLATRNKIAIAQIPKAPYAAASTACPHPSKTTMVFGSSIGRTQASRCWCSRSKMWQKHISSTLSTNGASLPVSIP